VIKSYRRDAQNGCTERGRPGAHHQVHRFLTISELDRTLTMLDEDAFAGNGSEDSTD
jgi:hypothetical protein